VVPAPAEFAEAGPAVTECLLADDQRRAQLSQQAQILSPNGSEWTAGFKRCAPRSNTPPRHPGADELAEYPKTMIKVAFLVNGEYASAMGERARAFAGRLWDRYDISIYYRSRHKILSLLRFFVILIRLQPQVCYVFDMAYSAVGGVILYRWVRRTRLVIDTGDAITELARSLGRGPVGIRLTRWLETLSVKAADRLVVRGSYHKEWLAQRGISADVIQDGVDCSQVTPLRVEDLRRRYHLEGVLTVGLVGSSVWSPKLECCYGWDLVEVIRLLKDRPVRGILIGDGSGLPLLRERCRSYGIEDRVLFLGRIPYDQLPLYLNLIDVCLSTQTNDLVGQVRTTGKLPLYLAAGRFVLASKVGEAARVLDEDMLVDFEGQIDSRYPEKLAERIRRLLDDRRRLDRRMVNVDLARQKFDYGVLAKKIGQVIDEVAARP
jgi:glycosyltransferase involved in cell wall biosynthesis